MTNHDFLPDDFEQKPLAERARFLKDIGDEVAEETYHKPLSGDERAGLKDKLSEVSIELSNEQAEYDEVKLHWREDIIKPLQEAQSETIQKLKTGTEQISGHVIYIRDHEAGKVVKMAEDGTTLETRPMRSNERQMTTQSNIRNISNSNS